MALIAKFLIDTSAAARMHHATVAERLAPLIEAGLVATHAALDAEAFFSARSAHELAQLREDRRTAYEHLLVEDRHWQAAFDALQGLAELGMHRAVGIADLLTAVVAQEYRLTIVHYDADFDLAARVLEFDRLWVVPAGSVP